MIDQLIGLVMFGLGLSNPVQPQVLGDETNTEATVDPKDPNASGQNDFNAGKFFNQTDQSNPRLQRLKEEAKELFNRNNKVLRPSISPPLKVIHENGMLTDEVKEMILKNSQERESRLKELFESRMQKSRQEVVNAQKQAETAAKDDRAVFQAKLRQAVTDARKQQIATNVESKMGYLNKQRTTNMGEHLTKMQEIVDKVSARAASAKAAGKDVSIVETNIAKAQAEISAARAKVTTQAAQTYVPTFTSEEKLGESMKDSLQKIHTDLKSTQGALTSARKAVRDAIVSLGKVMDAGSDSGSNTTK